MKKQEIEDKIMAVFYSSPLSDRVAQGDVFFKCKEYSEDLYQLLQDPKNAIPGLSVAVVKNMMLDGDHGWIVAHHPDVGYFMIDTTIGQFAEHSDGKPLNSPFIGTYKELRHKFTAGDYVFSKQYHFDEIWSPSLEFFRNKNEAGEFYECMKPDDEALWKKHHFTIEHANDELTPLQQEALWAARNAEAGHSWKDKMAKLHGRKEGEWPNPENATEMRYYGRIATEAEKRFSLQRRCEVERDVGKY